MRTGLDFGRHSHETYVIGVIEEGVGGNYYRGSAHYIPAGAVLVMTPDEPHTGYAAEGLPKSRLFAP